MKIKCITTHTVLVPAKSGAIAGQGIQKPLHKLPVGAKAGWSVQFDQIPKLIVKMEIDNGVIGWGELYRGHNSQVVQEIANGLIDCDLKSLSLQKLPFVYSREYDGFECALWDAYAKCHNLRVVDLLGGAVRDQVKVGAWSSHRHIEEIGELARHFTQQGFDCLKFKCDLDDDVVGWATAVKEVAPNLQLILDPNERWQFPAEARKRLLALQEVGNILCLEDPLPRWKLPDYVQLRNLGAIPIVLHVSLPYIIHGQRKKDAIQALMADAVDGFNFNGGLTDFQRLDHIAHVAELPCWHGSELDLGILEAMYVHSAAAASSCIWPSDIFGRLIRSHDLLKTPLTIIPPFVQLPKGLGLGVEVDEEALKEFQIEKMVYS